MTRSLVAQGDDDNDNTVSRKGNNFILINLICISTFISEINQQVTYPDGPYALCCYCGLEFAKAARVISLND